MVTNEELAELLRGFEGGTVFLHVEVTPGAFVRNVKAEILKSHVAGEGMYRVALQLPEDGWIRAEGLTHAVVDEEGRLIIASHDELGRLTVALEISREKLPA